MYIISLGHIGEEFFRAGKKQGQDLGVKKKKKRIDMETKTEFLMPLFMYSGSIISMTSEDQT